jgi:hypothetical protein
MNEVQGEIVSVNLRKRVSKWMEKAFETFQRTSDWSAVVSRNSRDTISGVNPSNGREFV